MNPGSGVSATFVAVAGYYAAVGFKTARQTLMPPLSHWRKTCTAERAMRPGGVYVQGRFR